MKRPGWPRIVGTSWILCEKLQVWTFLGLWRVQMLHLCSVATVILPLWLHNSLCFWSSWWSWALLSLGDYVFGFDEYIHNAGSWSKLKKGDTFGKSDLHNRDPFMALPLCRKQPKALGDNKKPRANPGRSSFASFYWRLGEWRSQEHGGFLMSSLLLMQGRTPMEHSNMTISTGMWSSMNCTEMREGSRFLSLCLIRNIELGLGEGWICNQIKGFGTISNSILCVHDQVYYVILFRITTSWSSRTWEQQMRA